MCSIRVLYLSFACLPVQNKRREGPNPHETQREQPCRFNKTNNTSIMHMCVMAKTYLSSGLSACSVLFCLLLLIC